MGLPSLIFAALLVSLAFTTPLATNFDAQIEKTLTEDRGIFTTGVTPLAPGSNLYSIPRHLLVDIDSLTHGLSPLTGAPILKETLPLLSGASATNSSQRLHSLWSKFLGMGPLHPGTQRGELGGRMTGEFWALVVWLMRERALDALGASHWGAFLATLPTTTPKLPFLWTPRELDRLQDPLAAATALGIRKDVHWCYNVLKRSAIAGAFDDLAATVLAVGGGPSRFTASPPSSSSPPSSGPGGVNSIDVAVVAEDGGVTTPTSSLFQVPGDGPSMEALQAASQGVSSSSMERYLGNSRLLFESNAAWVARELNVSLTVARTSLVQDLEQRPRQPGGKGGLPPPPPPLPSFLGGEEGRGYRLSSPPSHYTPHGASSTSSGSAAMLDLFCALEEGEGGEGEEESGSGGGGGGGAVRRGGGLPAFQCSHDSLASFTWAVGVVHTHSTVVEGVRRFIPRMGVQGIPHAPTPEREELGRSQWWLRVMNGDLPTPPSDSLLQHQHHQHQQQQQQRVTTPLLVPSDRQYTQAGSRVVLDYGWEASPTTQSHGSGVTLGGVVGEALSFQAHHSSGSAGGGGGDGSGNLGKRVMSALTGLASLPLLLHPPALPLDPHSHCTFLTLPHLGYLPEWGVESSGGGEVLGWFGGRELDEPLPQGVGGGVQSILPPSLLPPLRTLLPYLTSGPSHHTLEEESREVETPFKPRKSVAAVRASLAAALNLTHASVTAAQGEWCGVHPSSLPQYAAAGGPVQAWLAIAHMGLEELGRCGGVANAAFQERSWSESDLAHCFSSNPSSSSSTSSPTSGFFSPAARAFRWEAALLHTLFHTPPLNHTSFGEDLVLLALVGAFRESGSGRETSRSKGNGAVTTTTTISGSLREWAASSPSLSTPFEPVWWENLGCPPSTTPLFPLLLASTWVGRGKGDKTSTVSHALGLLHSVGLGMDKEGGEGGCQEWGAVVGGGSGGDGGGGGGGSGGSGGSEKLSAVFGALTHRVATKGALWLGLNTARGVRGGFTPSSLTTPQPQQHPAPSLSQNNSDTNITTPASTKTTSSSSTLPNSGTVLIGQALLPPRTAALYVTEEGHRSLAERCAAFNAWWHQGGGVSRVIGGGEFEVLPVGVGEGVYQGKVALFFTPSRARGGGGLRVGDPLFDIPLSLTMSVDTVLKCPLVGPLLLRLREEVGGGSGDDLLDLVVHLMVEAARGNASHWHPYIALLPTPLELPTPTLYTPSELRQLTGSLGLVEALKDESDVARKYGTIRGLLFEPHPEVFGVEAWGLGGGEGEEGDSSGTPTRISPHFSYPVFAWAHAVVMGRAQWIERHSSSGGGGGGKKVEDGEEEEGWMEPFLIPVLDMISLSFPAPAAAAFDDASTAESSSFSSSSTTTLPSRGARPAPSSVSLDLSKGVIRVKADLPLALFPKEEKDGGGVGVGSSNSVAGAAPLTFSSSSSSSFPHSRVYTRRNAVGIPPLEVFLVSGLTPQGLYASHPTPAVREAWKQHNCVPLHLPLPLHLRQHLRTQFLLAQADVLESLAERFPGVTPPCDPRGGNGGGGGPGEEQQQEREQEQGVLGGVGCKGGMIGAQGLSLGELETLILWGVGDTLVQEVDAAGEVGTALYLSGGASALEASEGIWWRDEQIFLHQVFHNPSNGGAGGGASGGGATVPALSHDLWGIAERELIVGWGGEGKEKGKGKGSNPPPSLPLWLNASASKGSGGRPIPHLKHHPLVHDLFKGVFQEGHSPILSDPALMDVLEFVLPYTSTPTGAARVCLPPKRAQMHKTQQQENGGRKGPPHHADSSSSSSSSSGSGSGGGSDDVSTAMEFLMASYGVNASGSHLLLAGAARARLRAYPHTLFSDLSALVGDAIAGVALGLEVEEEAEAWVASLISHVYGSPQPACCSRTSSTASGKSRMWGEMKPPTLATLVTLGKGVGMGGGGGGGGTTPPSPLFGCTCLSHFRATLSTLLEPAATAAERRGEGGGAGELEGTALTNARAALLSPRVRAIRTLLLNEKVILAGWAGWAPGKEGVGGWDVGTG